MKKLLTLTCIVFLVTLSYSQQKYHYVELINTGESKPIRTNFKCTKVIDKRLVKDNIGYAQKGLANKIVIAKLNGKFEELLKNSVNSLIKPYQNSENVILIIHELEINERVGVMSAIGICRLEVEFIREKDSSYFSLGRYSHEMEGLGLEVTGKHGERILGCLEKCLYEFSVSGWNTKIPLEQVTLHKELAPYNYRIIPQKGMYSSFTKLWKNEPMEKFKIRLEPKFGDRKVQRYVLKILDKRNKKRRIMFLSNGESIYMHSSRYSYNKHYIKAKHMGRYIYFEDRVSDKNAIMMFGLTGAGISNMQRGIILDTTNGQVSFLTESYLISLIKENKEIMLEYKKSNRKKKDKELAIVKLNRNTEEENKFR